MINISVILPVYNGSKTLTTCIESITSQDYSDYEIVAIDDGSTDNSLEILESYPIKIIRQKNSGVSAARNAGAALAKGQYLAFIDQDDKWMPEKLSRQVEFIDKNNNVLYVFTNFKRFSYNGSGSYSLSNSELNPYIYSWPHIKHPIKSGRIFDCNDAMELLLNGYPIYPSTMLINKDILVRAGGWNNIFPRCQDLDISLRCSRITKFCYVDLVLTEIGRHETNVSSDFINQLEEDIDVLKYHLEKDIFDFSEKKRISYYLGMRLCNMGWHHFNRGNATHARHCYFQALRYPSGFFRALINIPFTFYPLSLFKVARNNMTRNI